MGACLLLLGLLAPAAAIFLPGVAPRGYEEGEAVAVWANELTSRETVLGHEYSHYDLCPATDPADYRPNLGQRLFGDRYQQTAYEINFLRDTGCSNVCTKEYNWDKEDDRARLSELLVAIRDEYYHHWVVDNLDVLLTHIQGQPTQAQELGHPLGLLSGGAYVVLNHANLTILYHDPETLPVRPNTKLIVGAQLALASRISCGKEQPLVINPQGGGAKQVIRWTYEVHFQASPLRWASRWDPYLAIQHAEIRWLSIANSLVIVLFLSGMVAMILLRTVYRDIARYNRLDIRDEEEQGDESGWKMVHGDVFRAPSHSLLLSALVGSGSQLLAMVSLCLLFSFLHLLSPVRRGSILTGAVVLFVCLGALAGYVAARMDRMFGGARAKANVALTALLVPGLIFSIFLLLNTVLWAETSASHVAFGPMLLLIGLWFLVSLPLTAVGAYLGYRKPAPEPPVRINQIAREIPVQPRYMGPVVSVLLAGLLPFLAIFIELYFLLGSVWNHRLYFLPFFLLLVFAILVVVCAEVTVLLAYFQLCQEDHQWWWPAYWRSAGPALYFFAYSIYYLCTALTFKGAVNTFLYLGFTLLITIAFAAMTGCVGLLVTLLFVRRIYGSVKID